LEKLKQEGPSPQKKYQNFLQNRKEKSLNYMGEKKIKTSRTPFELHRYLMSKIVDVKTKVRKEIFFFNPKYITSKQTNKQTFIQH